MANFESDYTRKLEKPLSVASLIPIAMAPSSARLTKKANMTRPLCEMETSQINLKLLSGGASQQMEECFSQSKNHYNTQTETSLICTNSLINMYYYCLNQSKPKYQQNSVHSCK